MVVTAPTESFFWIWLKLFQDKADFKADSLVSFYGSFFSTTGKSLDVAFVVGAPSPSFLGACFAVVPGLLGYGKALTILSTVPIAEPGAWERAA